MFLIVILLSKLRIYCSKETEMPICLHLSILFGTETSCVAKGALQLSLQGDTSP